jgi:hypothetical protein
MRLAQAREFSIDFLDIRWTGILIFQANSSSTGARMFCACSNGEGDPLADQDIPAMKYRAARRAGLFAACKNANRPPIQNPTNPTRSGLVLDRAVSAITACAISRKALVSLIFVQGSSCGSPRR